jgi:hypothetical protein
MVILSMSFLVPITFILPPPLALLSPLFLFQQPHFHQ